ncbi:MAG: FUSC family protein, partial [Ruminococcus sp.]|nr:FUSC family protein [Ruminococcus sp.]
EEYKTEAFIAVLSRRAVSIKVEKIGSKTTAADGAEMWEIIEWNEEEYRESMVIAVVNALLELNNPTLMAGYLANFDKNQHITAEGFSTLGELLETIVASDRQKEYVEKLDKIKTLRGKNTSDIASEGKAMQELILKFKDSNMRSNLVTGVVNRLVELDSNEVTLAYLKHFDKNRKLNGAGTLGEFLADIEFQVEFDEKLRAIRTVYIYSAANMGGEMYELIRYKKEGYLTAVINALAERHDNKLLKEYLSGFDGSMMVNLGKEKVTLLKFLTMIDGYTPPPPKKDFSETALGRIATFLSGATLIGMIVLIVLTIFGITPWYFILIDTTVFFITIFIPNRFYKDVIMDMPVFIAIVPLILMITSYIAPIPLVILAVLEITEWYWVLVDICIGVDLTFWLHKENPPINIKY